MRIAADAQTLIAAPVGRYVTGRAFLYYFPRRDLNGFALWGRPDRDDIAQLTAVMEVEQRADLAPHASLVDVRDLESADAGAFAQLAAYLARCMTRYAQVITRQALVRPSGLPGAVVAGFFDVVPASYPTQVFAAIADAHAWLRTPAAAADEIEDALQASRHGALVPRLGELLRGELHADPDRAARQLGLSLRTLQRRLRGEGTTFLHELHRARIEAAKPLLQDTDRKLAAIAREVGYPTPQLFARWFRQLAGMAPSRWRARRD